MKKKYVSKIIEKKDTTRRIIVIDPSGNIMKRMFLESSTKSPQEFMDMAENIKERGEDYVLREIESLENIKRDINKFIDRLIDILKY